MTFITIDGWQWIDYERLGSTNDEAKKLIEKHTPLVVTAKKQTSGRGRMGHKWIGLDGNLFMSLGVDWNSDNTNILALISSLALLLSVKSYAATLNPMLKWPNDILVNKRKISGILLEVASSSKVIIGIGVNIKASPELEKNSPYLSTSLKELGIDTDRLDFMRTYLHIFAETINLYHQARAQKIIDMWLSYAHKIGQEITVKGEKTQICGKFIGLDKQGMLLLKTPDNEIRTISAGDIYF